jgi:hypothetical protein
MLRGLCWSSGPRGRHRRRGDQAAAVAAAANSHVPLQLFVLCSSCTAMLVRTDTVPENISGGSRERAGSVARSSEMQRRKSASHTCTEDASDTSALRYQDDAAGSMHSVISKSYHSFQV